MMDGSLQIRNAPCDSANQSQRFNNNRRGMNTRMSYTVESKKSLDLLDSMITSRDKYRTVAKQQGIMWGKKQKQNISRTDSA